MIEIDESTEFGARVTRHLREDVVVWLTTVSQRGGPVPTPVWFLWDGDESVLVFSLEKAVRVRHIETNPRVSLNFTGDGRGGDIVVLSGEAHVDADAPLATGVDEYIAKYADQMTRIGYAPDEFAARYSVAIRIRLTRVWGH